MKKSFSLIFLLAFSVLAFACTPQPATFSSDLVKVSSPEINGLVSSPLVISGEARGPMFFEAQFDIVLYDANELMVATVPATAQGEWMTENFVPFLATLEFNEADIETETGILVLQKANPSGLPENSRTFEFPVRFR